MKKSLMAYWSNTPLLIWLWHNEYGDEITGIYDDDEILKNVRIDTKNSDGFKIIIFEFEPTVVMDKTTLMTRVWDNERNVVNNYFIDAIKIIDGDNSELTQTSKVQPTVPDWIKNNAEWWAQNQIDDNTFLSGIEFLIKNQAIQISKESQTFSQNSEEIPDWIKNNAEWWAQGLLSDSDFIKGIEYLVEHGIITI